MYFENAPVWDVTVPIAGAFALSPSQGALVDTSGGSFVITLSDGPNRLMLVGGTKWPTLTAPNGFSFHPAQANLIAALLTSATVGDVLRTEPAGNFILFQ